MQQLLRDYNGTGRWAAADLIARYRDYAARLGIDPPRDLTPNEFVQGSQKWVCPVMEKVIAGIELGDAACMVIGVEFLEEDRKFPFGRALKYQTARALRRAAIPPALARRLRSRIVSMLVAGNVPREYREYARLLRRIGFDDWWERIDARVPRDNPYVMRYYTYFRRIHERSPAVIRNAQRSARRPQATGG